MIPSHIASLLKCPITGKSLERLTEPAVVKFNQLSKSLPYYFGDGAPVKMAYEGIFKVVGEDIYYPIQQDIICLIPDFAMVRDFSQYQVKDHPLSLEIKQDIKQFYDQIGWQKTQSDFNDAVDSEDLRKVSKQYIHQCHQRLNQYLPTKGQYLLDVASGPIQYPDYLTYSNNFEYRICADLSLTGLLSAKEKLGSKGIYILCDITNLPLQNDQIDSVISLHTIYHVPQNQQEKAFSELYRVLKPGGKSVVVYSWGKHSLLMKILLGPFKAIKRIYQKIKNHKPALYFHANSYDWFVSELKKKYSTQLYVWRSVNVPFLKIYIHRFLAGNMLLKGLYGLENRFPTIMGRIGAYPIFVTEKNSK